MPISRIPATTKRISETVASELFRFNLGGASATAINLGNDIDVYCRIGVIHSHHDRTPFYMNIEKNKHCLSFGLDWKVECLLGQETFPEHRVWMDRPTVLWKQSDHLILRFDRFHEPDSVEFLSYDLISCSRADADVSGVPFAEWSISVGGEDDARQSHKPLIGFKASAPAD